MTHTEALDLMLSHACPSSTYNDERGTVSVFIIDTHCVSFEVHAILKSTVGTIKYDVVFVTLA